MKNITSIIVICAVSAIARFAFSEDAAPKLSAIDIEFGELSSELVEMNSDLREKQLAVERLLASPAEDSDEAKAIRKRILDLKEELANAEGALRDERAKNPKAKKLIEELAAARDAMQGKVKRLAELKKLRAEAAEAAKPNKPVSKTGHDAPVEDNQ